MIPYAMIEAFDADQLWAQVYDVVRQLPYEKKSQCFRLSAEDRKELDARNKAYEKPIKAEYRKMPKVPSPLSSLFL